MILKYLISSRRVSPAKIDKDIQTAKEIAAYLLGIPEQRKIIEQVYTHIPQKWRKDLHKIISKYDTELKQFLEQLSWIPEELVVDLLIAIILLDRSSACP